MQKVFTGMHRIYSSAGGMSIYPVVFNLEWLLKLRKCGSKRKPDFVKFWCNSIARYSGGAPILLIGTHKDRVVSGSDLKLSNAELAKTNPDMAWAQEFMGNLITGMPVYKLKKLNLHMPPQPSLLRPVVALMLVSYVHLLHDITLQVEMVKPALCVGFMPWITDLETPRTPISRLTRFSVRSARR
jgi:hypothetical protein